MFPPYVWQQLSFGPKSARDAGGGASGVFSRRYSDGDGRDPGLVGGLMAVDDRLHEGHTLEAVIGERKVAAERGRRSPFPRRADRFGEPGIEIGEGFEIALGMA